jgi:DNA-binding winged helix-turn-helix (wHTH) protein/Tol biopolymer transport system component
LRDREASSAAVLHLAGDVLAFGPYRFDRANRILSREDAELPLPPRVLGVLEQLVTRPGRVVSKQALMDAVWKDAVVTETSLTEAVSQLRQALADDPQHPAFIQTVHRRGYRFVASVAVDGARRGHEPLLALDPEVEAASDTGDGAGRLRWPLLAAGLAIGLAIGGAVRQASSPPILRVTRATLPLGLGDGAALGAAPSLAMTPDGSELVVVLTRGGRSQLYARALDRFDAAPLAGTEGATEPFVSPDGRWIGFFADGKLKKVPVGGGAPVTLCEAKVPLGASWGDDGTIVFAHAEGEGLFRVPATGGTPERLTSLDTVKGEIGHWWPEVLPGSAIVVFTIWPTAGLDQARLAVAPLKPGAGPPRTLLAGATYGRYAPTGHLVFLRKSRLMAARIAPRTGDLQGAAVGVLDGVTVDWFRGAAQLAFSQSGALAYLPGTHEVPAHAVVAVARDGKEEPIPLPSRPFMNLDAVPDGSRVAFTIHEGTGSELWVADLPRHALTRLTFEAHNIEPAISSDGRRLAFASSRNGPMNLYAVDTDGSGAVERLISSPLNQYPDAFSPDGRFLAYVECSPETGTDLWVLPFTSAREPRPLLRTRFDEESSSFSPDGRFLAYDSNETNRFETYVAPFPAMSPKWQVSVDGGFAPAWSRDGRELYYMTEGAVMAVPISTVPGFKAGPPRRLLADPGLVALTSTATGLLVVRGEEKGPLPPLHLVLGWFEELTRLAGGPS